MASTTTRRKGGAPRSMELYTQMEQVVVAEASPINSMTGKPLTVANVQVPVATVKRHKFGTGPFDEHWLNLDCCGLLCATLTYGLHMFAVYAVCMVLLPPWMSETNELGVRSFTLAGHFHRLCFSAIAVLAVAAHFKAMTTDPGAVPPDAIPLEEVTNNNNNNTNGGSTSSNPLESEQPTESESPIPRKGKRLCRRCKTFKPKRAHHCSVCRRCIIKMDHHCPWVNNCVGIGNHKFFLLFIFYTFLSCLYSFMLVMTRFFSCMGRHGHVRAHHMTCLDKPTQLLTILGLVVEAILFGLFTSCMMIDQSSVVTSKMTHIDRLKGEDDAASSLAGVVEVFGLHTRRGNDQRFRPDWLSPFAKVCFPSSLHDEIMGFCRPCRNAVNNNSKETERTISNVSTASSMVSVAEIV